MEYHYSYSSIQGLIKPPIELAQSGRLASLDSRLIMPRWCHASNPARVAIYVRLQGGLCNDLGATQWSAHRLVPSTQNKDLSWYIMVNRHMATSANAAPINNSGKYTHWWNGEWYLGYYEPKQSNIKLESNDSINVLDIWFK